MSKSKLTEEVVQNFVEEQGYGTVKEFAEDNGLSSTQEIEEYVADALDAQNPSSED